MSGFLSPAWLWLYAGVFLMLFELLAPGFVVFFFGLSAATVALLVAVLPEAFSLNWQLAAFSVLAVTYLVLLRRYMKVIFSGATESSKAIDSEYIGRTAIVKKTIRPRISGRILLGDAQWDASASERIEEGSEVRIIAQNNLTFTVEPLAAE